MKAFIVRNISINFLDRRRRLILWPLAAGMRLWCRTLRMELPAEEELLLREMPSPVILLFWHNRLFMVAEARRRFRQQARAYGLVSASKDGAWMAAFLNLVGVGAVRGSSSRRGYEALRELQACLTEGGDVALTPDGPRGPMYSFKPGAAILTRRSKARVLLVGFDCRSAWKLRSWDRFRIPKPFSRVTIRCREVEVATLPKDLSACAESLGTQLAELAPD